MLSEEFKRALMATKLLRQPDQKIETFWNTEINYLILSELSEQESCLRTGSVVCEKPRIISRDSLLEEFSGFSTESVRFAEIFSAEELSRLRLLGYKFTNNFKLKEIHTLPFGQLKENIQNRHAGEKSNTAIVSVPDDIWSLSLVKIIVDIVARSFKINFEDLEERGFFKTSDEQKKSEIDFLFSAAEKDKSQIKKLGAKLQEYHLFREYEDRFFRMVGRG